MTTINELLKRFPGAVALDFEFVSSPGKLPDIICWHAILLATGEHIARWYEGSDQDPGPPPIEFSDPGSLLICYVANAECLSLLRQRWPLAVNVLDLSPEFRCLTNGLKTPEGKGLSGALRWFGLHAIETEHKKAMQKRAMKGWPFTAEERAHMQGYCRGDVEALIRLLEKMLPLLDLNLALYRGESVAVNAIMEFNGVPIDMELFPRLQDKQTWAAVRDATVPEIDAAFGVYTQDKFGEWHFNIARFAAYLARNGIAWPLTKTGKLALKGKVWDGITRGHPQLEPLRQLKYMRDKLRRLKLAVDPVTGRNRTVLWPFKAKTGRTQPPASEWIFSPAVWLRFLIKPVEGTAIAYIDYSAMEFFLAAALSGDPLMLEMYRSGDPYTAFAVRVGAVPAGTVRAPDDIRNRYKVGLLGIQYGMQATTLAGRLGISIFAAQEMLDQHHALFTQYWRWSDDWLQHAHTTGQMRTVFGWTCQVGDEETRDLSIRNWPVQATGAEILRIACILMHRHGNKLLAPVHDAVLIEAPIAQIEAHVARAKDLMVRASRIVLGQGFELRADAKIVSYPDSYTDRRGAEMWAKVKELLDRSQQLKRVSEA